ncbi:MAG: VCBS repeat-containing protein, partial [Chthoniobacterales bacterium]|nr:VCBS repeat-containing protein [Chthoniobacterales bacterium]
MSNDAVAQSFAPPVDYPPGGLDPGGASLADFNKDGHLDVLNAAFRANRVSLLVGTGSGALQAPTKISVGSGPVSTAVADFNHDGNMDFVVAIAYGRAIQVALGKGDGTFQTPVLYPAGSAPAGLAVGDFNNDGNADVAVADASGGSGTKTVQILYGKSDGTLAPAIGYDTGATDSFRIAAADFNGDSFLDLVVTEQQTNTVRFLVGQSNGAFVVSPKKYSVPATAG